MKTSVPGATQAYAAIVLVSLLAACGGGGSGPMPPTGGGGGGNPSPTPTATPTLTPSTTVAQGTLVDDPSGTPLAGVTVRLDPWTAYPTPGPTPTPIAVSTTDPQGHFIVNAPNGTYLLVIGADTAPTPPPGWSTPDPNATETPIPGATGWRATIHDRIVLKGGGTLASPLPLLAPTMPPQPLYTPPPVEMNGDYRLLTLDSLVEAPCILAFNQLRASKALAPAVVDEWSQENARAIAWVGFQPNGGGQYVQDITTGDVFDSGGANCADATVGYAWSKPNAQAWMANPQTLWFGGAYHPYNAQHSGAGTADFPIDPRVNVDPSGLIWP